MLRPSFFIFISLTSSICHGFILHGPMTSPTRASSNSIISPDHYDEIGNLSMFAVADFFVERNYYQVSLRLENWQDQTYKECLFNVTTGWPVVKAGATGLRHLKVSSIVVLTWYDEIYEDGLNHRRRPLIVAMNMNDYRSSDLGLQNLIRDPIVQPVDHEEFSVYLVDPVHCKYYKRCVIHYNANYLTSYDHPVSLDIQLDWSTLKIEDVDMYGILAHGFDDSNIYRVMRSRSTVMSWNNANPRIAVVASQRSLCWVENPNVDTAVNCSLFDNKGKILYSKTTEFGVPVTPLAVRFLMKDKLLLLTGQTSCWNDKSCWELTWTIVSDISISGVEKFDCTGDRKSLVVSGYFKRDYESRHYWYTCKKGNRYVYNEKHFKG